MGNISFIQRKKRELAQLEALRAQMLADERKKRMKAGDEKILIKCESLIGFAEEAWHILEPKAVFKTGWAIDAIAHHLEHVTAGDIKHLLVNVPPGFMKSLLTKVFWPAWEWGPMNLAEMRYVTASYTKHLSNRDALKLKRLVTSDWYQRLWPHVIITKDQSAKTNYQTTKTGFMFATSVSGTGTGERGDRFIDDDPNSVKDVESSKKRDSANQWRSEVVPTRINDADKSAIIDIQQRTHMMDVSGFLMHADNLDPDTVHLCIPMEYEKRLHCKTPYWEDPRTKEGELAWPERFTRVEVDKLKKRLGIYAVACQLQQDARPRGGGIIKEEWWKEWEFNDFPEFEFIISMLDGAYTKDDDNDPSAMTVWGIWRDPVTRHPNVMLMYAWEEHLEFHELIKKVNSTNKRYYVDKLIIENKASGLSVAQEMRRQFKEVCAVELIDPAKNSKMSGGGDKVARAFSVSYIFEQGLVWHPVIEPKGIPKREWVKKVVDQVGAMTPSGSVASHDDLTDTVTGALRWLRHNHWVLTPDEGTGEVHIYGKALVDQNENIYDV